MLVAQAIGGGWGGVVGVLAGIVAFFLVLALDFAIAVGVVFLFPGVTYTVFPVIEERSAQELSLRSKYVARLLKRRPHSSRLVTACWWIGGGSLVLLGLLGIEYIWLARWTPFGLPLFILVMLIAWYCAVRATRIETGALAIDNLIEQQSADDAPLLVDMLEEGPYRAPAQKALERLGPAAAPMASRLQALFADAQVSAIRAAAASALGYFGAAANPAIPALLKAVEDGPENVRYAAIQAVGRLGRIDDVPRGTLTTLLHKLATNLGDTLAQTREQARDTLIAIGPAASAVLAEVQTLTRSSTIAIANDAQAVIAAIQLGRGATSADTISPLEFASGGDLQNRLSSLQVQLKSTDDAQRIAAAKSLAGIGAPAGDALPALRRMARRDKSANARQAALEAVAAVASGAPVRRALMSGMRDQDASVRTAAAEIWGRLGFPPERARPAVLATARDRHGRVGHLGLRALRMLILWSALVLLILDQIVVTRSTASILALLSFLPAGAMEATTWLVTTLKAHADFPSFMLFITICTALAAAFGFGLRAYTQWRHAVSDSAMRALPIFLVGIDDAGA